jgi:hypothetical protein
MNEWNHCIKGCLNGFTMSSQFIALMMATSTWGSTMEYATLLSSLCETLAFTWGQTQLYAFPQPFLILPINKSTFFTKDETHTHPNWCGNKPNTCEFISLILHNSKNCFQTQKRRYPDQLSLINSSLQQLKYLNVYTKRLMCSYSILPMPFGTSKG